MNESRSKASGAARASSLDALSKTIDGLEQRIESLVSRRLATAASNDPGRSLQHDDDTTSTISAPPISARKSVFEMGRAAADFRAASRLPSEAAAPDAAFRDVAASLVGLREELKQDFSDTLARELAALRGEIASGVSARTPPLPPALREELVRLSECIEKFGQHFSTQRNDGLADEVRALRDALDGIAEENRRNISAVAQKIGEADPQTLRSEVVGLVRRLEQMQESIRALDGTRGATQAEDQLKAVAAALETLAEQVNLDEASIDHRFTEMAGRLDEISRAIVSVGARADRTEDAETLARIENRVANLAERMEEFGATGSSLDHLADRMAAVAQHMEMLASEDSVTALGERLDQLSAFLEEGARSNGDGELARGLIDISAKIDALGEGAVGDALAARLDKLAASIDSLAGGLDAAHEDMFDRLEALAAHSSRDVAPLVSGFDDRLNEIVRHLEASQSAAPDAQTLRSLETQLAHLSELISHPAAAGEGDEALASRLASIEEHLLTNDEYVIEAARQAAEAVIEAHAHGEGGDLSRTGELGVISELAEDLRALEKLSQKSEERTARAFDAVHDTLLKIAEHLENLGDGQETDDRRFADDAMIEDDEAARFHAGAEMAKPAAVGLVTGYAQETPQAAGDDLARADDIDRPVLAEEENDDLFASVGEAGEAGDAVSARVGLLARVGRRMRLGRRQRPLPENGPMESEEERAQSRQDVGITPSIDPSDALGADEEFEEERDDSISPNQLLEPGSGKPEIDRILKQVRESQTLAIKDGDRADFIAAARRAAQAAAAEVDSAGTARDGKRGRSAERLKAQRRPILLAVGAILLVVMSWPLAKAYLKSPPEEMAAKAPQNAAPNRPPASAANAEISGPAVSNEKTGSTAVIDRQLPKVRALPASPPADTAAPPADGAQTQAFAGNSVEGDASKMVPAAQLPKENAALQATDAGASTAAAPTVGAAQDGAAAKADTAAASPPTPSASSAAAASQDAEPSASPATQPVAEQAAAPASTEVPPVPAAIGPESLRTAAAKGDPNALFEIGSRYGDGRGVANDFAEAAKWYRAAADRGVVPAEYRLANLYEKGQGVGRDVDAARELYLKAANAGNVSAMHNLAVLYAMGKDGKPDYADAAQWFRKAADHGVKDSQFNLAILYAQGNGVPRDMMQSYKWFAIAGAQGDADSNQKRDQIAAVLSAADLKKARQEVSDWKPLPVDPAANTVPVPPQWNGTDVRTGSIDMTKAIRNIQAILDNNGFDAGKPDGIMGEKTRSAIKAFQKSAGEKPTGEVTDALIKKLLDLNGKHKNG